MRSVGRSYGCTQASPLCLRAHVTQRQSETSLSVKYGFDACSQQVGVAANGKRGV